MESILKNLKTTSNQIPNGILTETGEPINEIMYNQLVYVEYLIDDMKDILNENN